MSCKLIKRLPTYFDNVRLVLNARGNESPSSPLLLLPFLILSLLLPSSCLVILRGKGRYFIRFQFIKGGLGENWPAVDTTNRTSEYTHPVWSLYLTNSGRYKQKTNFDCQIDKKRVGLEMEENSFEFNSLLTDRNFQRIRIFAIVHKN